VKTFAVRAADAVAPHLAARRAGVRIDLKEIQRWLGEHPAPVVAVETAGGLFSPLTDKGFTNADLVTALAPAALVLVAPDRLGVLHDLTATLGLAATRGLPAPVNVRPEFFASVWGANDRVDDSEKSTTGCQDFGSRFLARFQRWLASH